eukprot:1365376-Pyramimonas_sp.AAC.1
MATSARPPRTAWGAGNLAGDAYEGVFYDARNLAPAGKSSTWLPPGPRRALFLPSSSEHVKQAKASAKKLGKKTIAYK